MYFGAMRTFDPSTTYQQRLCANGLLKADG
jgi:hypothetical protein